MRVGGGRGRRFVLGGASGGGYEGRSCVDEWQSKSEARSYSDGKVCNGWKCGGGRGARVAGAKWGLKSGWFIILNSGNRDPNRMYRDHIHAVGRRISREGKVELSIPLSNVSLCVES